MSTRPDTDRRSAIYRGQVMHQRLKPLRHRLQYRMFMLLLDLDELPALHARLRWFSVGRFNVFSFRPSDHGDGTATDAPGLRAQIDARLASAGLPIGGAVRLLTMPRILGHVFNPLSVWFCDAPDGSLRAIVYEVNNTFGERHSYLIEVDESQRAAPLIEQRSGKRLYVSPFLGMALQYRFRIEPPRERLSIGVSVHERGEGISEGINEGISEGISEGVGEDLGKAAGKGIGTSAGSGDRDTDTDGVPVLTARLDANRTPLTDTALLRLLVTHPLLTLKVVAGIHWEALRLWLKGARLQVRPAAPDHPMTIVRSGGPARSEPTRPEATRPEHPDSSEATWHA